MKFDKLLESNLGQNVKVGHEKNYKVDREDWLKIQNYNILYSLSTKLLKYC